VHSVVSDRLTDRTSFCSILIRLPEPSGRQSGDLGKKWPLEFLLTDTTSCIHARKVLLHDVNLRQRRKANWIGHILRRNCLLKHVIEGKLEGRIDMTVRRGRRRKQLLDDLKEKRRYWKLKEEALDRPQWRTRFGRGYRPIVRQTTE
jgi:hypothetical protein